jgi:type IV secretion system protein VirB2
MPVSFNKSFTPWMCFGIAAVVMAASATATAFAASTINYDLPWNTSLTNFTNLLSGNMVKYVCLTALFISGTALIFGEDLGDFTKRLLSIAIAASVLLGAGSFFTTFLSGAVI